MANLQKRGDYTPRSQREKQAYRLAVTGAGTGLVGVVTFVLAIAGVTSFFAPIVLLLISALCVWRFMQATGKR
jgi:CHASE2 domain-containing sensor protein